MIPVPVAAGKKSRSVVGVNENFMEYIPFMECTAMHKGIALLFLLNLTK